MDLKTTHIGLIVLFQLVFTIDPVNLKGVGRECRLCKPGYYASRLCTEFHDTVCKPCSKGTFTSDQNVFKTCNPCSVCDQGEFASSECSLSRDTVCESCAAVKNNVNANFIKSCLQGDDPGAGIHLNDPSTVKLEKEEIPETEQSSAESQKYSMIPEGSGVGVIEDTADNKYPIANDTEEIEGSGVIPDIKDSDTTNASVSILPDDVNEDIVTTTERINTTTTREGVIEIGDGIILQNLTSNISDAETDLAKSVSTTKATTTTVIDTIVVNGSNGVVVDPEPTEKILYEEDEIDEAIDGGAIDVEIEVNEEPQTGASHTQHRDESNGVSAGVVVTVGLVAALVFFIIGFAVSRYWSRRQERTFNVQEAERRNGKPPIECSGIEYKDPENNIPGKTNIYGSLPAKTANGSTPEVKPQHAQSDRPISKAHAPTTGSQPDKPSEPVGPATKPRAESEIRYIDEGSADETETGALLPPTSESPNQNKAGNQSNTGSPSTPEVVNDSEANSETQADENTPMISKDTSSNS